jgi:hypothetical protein
MRDPTTDPDDLPKMQKTYDALCEEFEHYKIRAFAREDPFLHQCYVEQGRIGKDEVL